MLVLYAERMLATSRVSASPSMSDRVSDSYCLRALPGLLEVALQQALQRLACYWSIRIWFQSRISMSLPQQEGRTSPAFTWTVLLQVTQ